MEDHIQRNSRNKTRNERSKRNAKDGFVWLFRLYGYLANRIYSRRIQRIMHISEEGLCLIKKFEGCEMRAYKCAAGVPTIAYGRTKNVKMGDTCTKEQAEEWLKEEIKEYENHVEDAVIVPLNQNQFDALVSWTYNLGPTNLNSSTMLKVLNQADYENVPAQIKRWNKAGGKVLEGLTRRRNAESLLFEGKEWGKI